MDKVLRERVGRNAVTRRAEDILNAVLEFYIGDRTVESLGARLGTLFQEETQFITPADYEAAKAEMAERQSMGMDDGVPV